MRSLTGYQFFTKRLAFIAEPVLERPMLVNPVLEKRMVGYPTQLKPKNE